MRIWQRQQSSSLALALCTGLYCGQAGFYIWEYLLTCVNRNVKRVHIFKHRNILSKSPLNLNSTWHNLSWVCTKMTFRSTNTTHITTTGCFIMKVKKFELHTQARIQAVSWERCTFSNEILSFWNCACKNSKEFHVFFKFCMNFDAQIDKIHWKLRIKQMSVFFCEYPCNKSSVLYEVYNLSAQGIHCPPTKIL